MKRHLLILPVLAGLLTSCSTPIEQVTPAAPSQPAPYYAPSSQVAQPAPAPLDSGMRDTEKWVNPEANREPLSSATRQPKASESSQRAASASNFRQAYAGVGKPRITIFYNRHISDSVDEWSKNVNTSTTFEHNFENQMNRAFIKEKTRIVDRATVVNLAAVDSGKSVQDLEGQLATKAIEITALREYTDIFIEIHIKADSKAPSGYLFRAIAKEIQTGQILADTLCNNFGAGDVYIVPGASGFDYAETLPDLDAAAFFLSEQLMADLSESWE